jgi:hypothetical protein
MLGFCRRGTVAVGATGGMSSVRRKILAVTVALMLGTATMRPDAMAGGRGGGHGFGSVHGGHGFGYGRGRGYGRYGYGYGYGLYWYPSYYENDNGPSDGFGDITSDVPPQVGFEAPPRKPTICKETVTVPSDDGGTRQIRMIRC